MVNEAPNVLLSRERTAHHEAAHAVMCLMKGCYVREVELFDKPCNGLAGVCRHYSPDYWRDDAWIALAGPAMDSIRYSCPMFMSYFSGGGSDFDSAYEAFQSWLAPRPRPEIKAWVPDSLEECRAMTDAIMEGWRPDDIQGQMKRKLTLYFKRYSEALEFVHELVHNEADAVKRYIAESQIFRKVVSAVAEELILKKRLNYVDLYTTYYKITNQRGK